jgi:hypothetical protein
VISGFTYFSFGIHHLHSLSELPARLYLPTGFRT